MGNDPDFDDDDDVIIMGDDQVHEKLQPSDGFKAVHDKLAQAIRELEEFCGVDVISIVMTDEGPVIEAGIRTDEDKDNFMAMMGATRKN